MDVAESGIVVRVSGASPDTFLVQGEVRLEIDLPEPWGEIRTLGTIRRVKSAQTAKDMTMVGIEYAGMAEADEKKLRNYLAGGD
jgi:c-di-GMP-binding flagellar brake protein YcgR